MLRWNNLKDITVSGKCNVQNGMSTVLPSGRGKGEMKTIPGQEEKKKGGEGGGGEHLLPCLPHCLSVHRLGGHKGN